MIVSELVAKNKRKQFTAHELADLIIKTEPEFCNKKMKKTICCTKELLVPQFMSEIGAQYPKMQFYNVGKTTTKPQKYFYKKSDIVVPALKAAPKTKAVKAK